MTMHRSHQFFWNPIGLSTHIAIAAILMMAGIFSISLAFALPETYAVDTSVSTASPPSYTYKKSTHTPINPVRVTSQVVDLDETVQNATVDSSGKLSLVGGTAEAVPGYGFDIANGSGYIYGHNRTNELEAITKLKPNDKVTVYGDNGEQYEYVMISSEIVPASYFHKIQEASDKNLLVLQTCVGWRSSQRLLVWLRIQPETVRQTIEKYLE